MTSVASVIIATPEFTLAYAWVGAGVCMLLVCIQDTMAPAVAEPLTAGATQTNVLDAAAAHPQVITSESKEPAADAEAEVGVKTPGGLIRAGNQPQGEQTAPVTSHAQEVGALIITSQLSCPSM